MPEIQNSYGNRWLTTLLLPEHTSPEILRLFLEEHNIESRPLWKPMHAQPLFSDAKGRLSGVSDNFFRRGICLPSGSSMRNEEVLKISHLIKQKLS
jgi:UDP-N-acetylbacillosamine transaminase